MILIDSRALQTYSYYRGIGDYIKKLINIYNNERDFYFLLFSRRNEPEIKINNKMLINSFTRMISFTDDIFLRNFLKKNSIDIYHSTAFGLPLRIKGVKYISTIHDLTQVIFKNFTGFKNRIIQKRFLKSSIRNADLIISVSNRTKDDLVERFKISEDRIRVVHQYIEFQGLDSKVCEKYFLPSNYMLYSGGFDKIKNLETMIRALPLVKIPLILTGYISDEHKKYLMSLIDYKFRKYIIFKGYVSKEELICYYKKARIFLFPSLYEGFGYPPLEALFFKIPVITSDRGSLKEVLKDYSVYLENPLNIEELAYKIKYVLNNYDDIKNNFKTREFEDFINYYSRFRFEKEMNKIYGDLR